MQILETKNLKKYYKNGSITVKAVDDITLTVKQDQFIAIIGASGSGKSTLLHLIGGLDYPTSGDVIIHGNNIFKMNEDERTIYRRRNIGFVFQNYNLIPILNVYQNIVLPVSLNKEAIEKEYFEDVLTSLHIKDKLKNKPNQLSGGEQQRVAIARAIISKPAIVLADEPTGNLDSKTSSSVIELFQKVKEKYNQTIIMITHDERYASMADEKIEIQDGIIK